MLAFHLPAQLSLLLIICLNTHLLHANTEQIQFKATATVDVPISKTSSWPRLTSLTNEMTFDMQPAPSGIPVKSVCETAAQKYLKYFVQCPHELWLLLDLDDTGWGSYSSFTLRVSWPASTPTSFDIGLYSPEALWTHLSHAWNGPPPLQDEHTPLRRIKYARIRAVQESARTPSKDPTKDLLSFNVILEPLLFGLVPISTIPTLFVLLVVLFCISFLVGPINRYLEGIALQARADVAKFA